MSTFYHISVASRELHRKVQIMFIMWKPKHVHFPQLAFTLQICLVPYLPSLGVGWGSVRQLCANHSRSSSEGTVDFLLQVPRFFRLLC